MSKLLRIPLWIIDPTFKPSKWFYLNLLAYYPRIKNPRVNEILKSDAIESIQIDDGYIYIRTNNVFKSNEGEEWK